MMTTIFGSISGCSACKDFSSASFGDDFLYEHARTINATAMIPNMRPKPPNRYGIGDFHVWILAPALAVTVAVLLCAGLIDLLFSLVAISAGKVFSEEVSSLPAQLLRSGTKDPLNNPRFSYHMLLSSLYFCINGMRTWYFYIYMGS